MVREVKKNGRLLMTQLGGYAWSAVEGENVTICAAHSGQRFRGVIQRITPSVHTSDDVRTGSRNDEDMEVRLDLMTASKDETLAFGINVGDFICFDPRVEITNRGFIKTRFLDDKAGVAIMYGVLHALARAGAVPTQRTTFFLSNYEEVGHGASTGIPGDTTELLVVDMAASTTGEHQNSDEGTRSVSAPRTRRGHMTSTCAASWQTCATSAAFPSGSTPTRATARTEAPRYEPAPTFVWGSLALASTPATAMSARTRQVSWRRLSSLSATQ